MSKTPKTPNDELDKFLLRMPNGLRDRIKASADESNRSMNAEIISVLETAFPEHSPYEYEELSLVYELDGVIDRMHAIRNAAIEQVEAWVSDEFKQEAVEPLKSRKPKVGGKVKLPRRD